MTSFSLPHVPCLYATIYSGGFSNENPFPFSLKREKEGERFDAMRRVSG
jgi:hypothetical protein